MWSKGLQSDAPKATMLGIKHDRRLGSLLKRQVRSIRHYMAKGIGAKLINLLGIKT